MPNQFIARKGLISLGDSQITGSNSLAGNYALKVTNTSGANILNVENDGNVGLGLADPSYKLQVRGDTNDSTDYPFRVENSSGTPLFRVRSDGYVMFGNLGESLAFDFTGGNRYLKFFNTSISALGATGITATGTIGFTPGTGTSNKITFINAADSYGSVHLAQGTAANTTFPNNRGTEILFNREVNHQKHYGVIRGDDNANQPVPLYIFSGQHTSTSVTQPLILQNLPGGVSRGNVGIGLEDPQTNLHVSSSVSASTYYGDGSNLTSLPTQDPFPYTGSAIISGSLEVEGDTYIDGFITASDTIWSQNSGGIAFKLNGGAAVRNTGRFYLDAHEQFTIRPDLDGGGNKFVTIVGDLLLSNNTNGVPQDRLHVAGNAVITGSNSLAGNYALKVANSSGTDLITAENDGNVELNNKVFVNGTNISYTTSPYALNVSESVNIRGVINFDNASHQAWIKTANSTQRSIKIPGTGGHGHFQLYNTSGNAIQFLNSSLASNSSLTLKTPNTTGNNALMQVSVGSSIGNPQNGGGNFIYYDIGSNPRTYTFGNPGTEGVAGLDGTNVKLTASSNGGGGGARKGGNVFIISTPGSSGGIDGKVYITGSTEITGSLNVTGNIAVTGTVDGVDIAASHAAYEETELVTGQNILMITGVSVASNKIVDIIGDALTDPSSANSKKFIGFHTGNGDCVLQGMVDAVSAISGATAGSPLWIGASGVFSSAAPTTANYYSRVVGYFVGTGQGGEIICYFDPSKDWIQID